YQWMFYHIVLGSGGYALQWIINSTTGSDCDLYIQYDNYPTRSSWRYRDISTRKNIVLTVPAASAYEGTWYAGVYGFTQCSFAVTANVMGKHLQICGWLFLMVLYLRRCLSK